MVICSLCRIPQCLSTEITLVSPSSSRDDKSDDIRRHLTVIRTLVIRRRKVRWHAEANMVICSLCRRPQCLWTKTILVSPLSSRDDKSDDTQKKYVHLLPLLETSVSFDRDYFSLTLVIRRWQVWWHAETPHGYLHPLSSRDSRVRRPTKILFCYLETNKSNSMQRPS